VPFFAALFQKGLSGKIIYKKQNIKNESNYKAKNQHYSTPFIRYAYSIAKFSLKINSE